MCKESFLNFRHARSAFSQLRRAVGFGMIVHFSFLAGAGGEERHTSLRKQYS